MAAKIHKRFLPVLKGYRSSETAGYIAQLEDQTRLLWEALEGVTPDELAWQPKRGQNTIGMLLAHLAIVEAFWLQFAIDGDHDDDELVKLLKIGMDDDGLPMPAGARPPVVLRGRTLAWYRVLLKRSRAYVTRLSKGITPAGLNKRHVRLRRDGTKSQMDVRWILYHVVEHFSGHFGQILLLRHQYRDQRS